MNECTGSIERVKHMVKAQLKDLANSHNIKLEDDIEPAVMLRSIIESLINKSKNNQIVLLLDEYDKPLLKHIGKEKVIPYQEFLKEFYTVIKDTDAYQRFTLITGVSKFAHVSIFSGLNNLMDLTMHPVAATLLGYTHEEMHDNFHENIQALAEADGITYDEAFEKLVFYYDGYRFTSKPDKLFNPVSIANTFSRLEYQSYWFATGTPSWLVPFMKSRPCFLSDKIEVSETDLDTFDPVSLEMLPLLLQTGYLTITDINNDYGERYFTLDFPNHEVKSGFSKWLMNAYISDNTIQNSITQRAMIEAVNTGKPNDMIEAVKAFYASIPYDVQDKMDVEQAYQNVMYVLFSYLGLQAKAEFRTNKGRIDILIQSPDFVYVIEMKLDKPAQEAMDQIHEKKYYEQFRNLDKQVFLIGLSFSSEEKNITEHLIEEINN